MCATSFSQSVNIPSGGEQMDDSTFYRIAASVHELVGDDVSDVEFAELVDAAASAHDRD